MGKILKPRVIGRPDPITGRRPDITEEAIRRKRPPTTQIPTPSPVTIPTTTGKEYVFEFSGPIGTAAAKYISKLAKLLGGKHAYIEDSNKLVVVL